MRINPLFAAAAFCAALLSGAAGAADRKLINIGTGGPTGVYFAAGNAVCRMIHKEGTQGAKDARQHGIRCSAPSTGGSTFNIDRVADGEFDFGIAQSDWQYNSYNGLQPDQVKPFKKLRSVFAIHPEPFQVIVSASSGVRSFTDLKGKKVNIGNTGSGQRGTMEVLMQAYGLTTRDFSLTTELSSTEQARALCEGKIDAFGYTVGVPNAGVAVATDSCGARIIGLNSPLEQALVEKNPYYAFATIPAGTYRTTDVDVVTFGVVATLVTSADQSEEVVYEVVRSVMENLEDFRSLHAAFARLDPKRMIKDGLSAPLHPGAIRYYKEKGWM